MLLIGCVSFARNCGKMCSRHLFLYGGFFTSTWIFSLSQPLTTKFHIADHTLHLIFAVMVQEQTIQMAQRSTGRLAKSPSRSSHSSSGTCLHVPATMCLWFWSHSSVSTVPRVLRRTTHQRIVSVPRLHRVSILLSLTNYKICCTIYYI